MLRPPYLQKNDSVAVIAPASKVSASAISAAKNCMEAWGLQVLLGENVLAGYYEFSGTDEQRASDFQNAINDPTVAAIVCARGGYGCSRIVDRIDFSPLNERPKWLVGYSDTTVLHARMNRMNMESIHGIMLSGFPPDGCDSESTESLRKALFGELTNYQIPPHEMNKEGQVKAVLIGGNLTLIGHLQGTVDALKTDDRILFIEDVGEYLYNIDRIMIQLKRGGLLNGLKGVIVGTFNKMKDNVGSNFGKSSYEIIAEHMEELDIPVAFGFPAGHSELNMSLYLGREVYLSVTKEGTSIDFL